MNNTYNCTVVVEPDQPGGYMAYVPMLPGCFSQGETIEEALKMIKEAIELHIETAEDHGQVLMNPEGVIISQIQLTRPTARAS